MHYELVDSFVVAADLAEVWRFFSSAENLPRITPPWLGFEVLPFDAPIRLHSRLDYRIRWMGLPLRWRTRIVDWTPPRGFVDLQVGGPYTVWHHRHTFVPVRDGTRCSDSVIYKVPGGPLGEILHDTVIERQLLDIFRHRRQATARELGWVRAVRKDVRVRRLG